MKNQVHSQKWNRKAWQLQRVFSPFSKRKNKFRPYLDHLFFMSGFNYLVLESLLKASWSQDKNQNKTCYLKMSSLGLLTYIVTKKKYECAEQKTFAVYTFFFSMIILTWLACNASSVPEGGVRGASFWQQFFLRTLVQDKNCWSISVTSCT